MSVAIIADIHANVVALDAVLADIERDSVDRVICLGDVAGTGPEPVRSLERLQQLECPVVMGNVDESMLDPLSDESMADLSEADRMFVEMDGWCAEQLTSAHETFIRSFEPTIEVELPDVPQLFCYHGSPRSHSEEVRATTSEERLDDLFTDIDADLLIGGHTHFPFTRRYKGALLLNPGSVGLPYLWDQDAEKYRNPPWAEYAVISGGTESLHVELRRCPLDVTAVINVAQESDMPHSELWIDGWRLSQ